MADGQKVVSARCRQVAIKRFHHPGDDAFKRELAAMLCVGVHPHVLRLLECFQASNAEDVLVLEYCDGPDVYELYSAADQVNTLPHLPELLVVRIVHQALLAIVHLESCGVEHRDVKPENMMMYSVNVARREGEMKLGDFGWASAPNLHLPEPMCPVGSLWYAAPELSASIQKVEYRDRPVGRADVWSLGVTTYLLLVGHNPFSMAMTKESNVDMEEEIERLASLGQYATKSSCHWQSIDPAARQLIASMLRARPEKRASPSSLLHHPYFTRALRRPNLEIAEDPMADVFVNLGELWERWTKLDALQQLCWVAVARAVSEPELHPKAIAAAMEGSGCGSGRRDAPYLEYLARTLACLRPSYWLLKPAAWSEVMRLAFCYLDVDHDGVLNLSDLLSHLSWRLPRDTTTLPMSMRRWLSQWQTLSMGSTQAMDFTAFRLALLASQHVGASRREIMDMLGLRCSHV
eukprot:NODE_6921_length_1625_cov_5.927236.p1 GENE.NODE_6921_length_1625_cov_5.927236~~NODE_6921_length_1625_cov_5.927236.p1  ORF type:complete len:511 (-),score=95.62 NODE_6921_length_1625_cov_5.927236:91-1479(-)